MTAEISGTREIVGLALIWLGTFGGAILVLWVIVFREWPPWLRRRS